ncbi:MAG: site-specific DNA-methyltransferase [Calditrichaeota bacterium]|nr:site-specific DNA-methyltransferase [Candidatus Cloacimonadota bacterium]MCB1046556.1 site-specific DNA-methyltransferase [Calditrichota bacterium]MCB9474783.1 site-specific DNA-methyltransferase [Candidatus Delongbacteria bacterium]
MSDPHPPAQPQVELEDRIHIGDNRELLARMPDACVDLVLTDPPYKDYQSNRPRAREKVKKIDAQCFDIPEFLASMERVMRDGAHFYCWCDHLSFPDLVLALRERKDLVPRGSAHLVYKNCLVWVKNNHGSGDLRSNWAPQHEFVLFASKGRARSREAPRSPNVFYNRDDEDPSRIRFVKRVSNYAFEHGTSKPVELLERMILMSSRPGELVFDPFAGSCSTGEAALRTGRRYLLAELDEDHGRRGSERLELVRQELAPPHPAPVQHTTE